MKSFNLFGRDVVVLSYHFHRVFHDCLDSKLFSHKFFFLNQIVDLIWGKGGKVSRKIFIDNKTCMSFLFNVFFQPHGRSPENKPDD